MGGAERAGTSRVTMRTVADAAGVHVSTVSRALRASHNEDTNGVSPEVIERIRAIAESLGYQPDPYAASLRTRRTLAIGVLVPQLADVVAATIYQGIDEYATEHGFQTLVANTHDDPHERAERARLLLSRRVDGLIFGDVSVDGASLVDLALPEGLPVTLVNRRARGHVSVTGDDLSGGRLVGEHLAELGHTRVGVVAGLSWASPGLERSRGCIETLAQHGIVIPQDHVLHSTFDAEGGRRAGEALLDRTPRPTAIFAVNDYAALGVMGAARARGLQIPKDLSIVGYNDISIARDLPVPLTTVTNPLNAIGRGATELLLKLLAGQAPRSRRLKPKLARRESTVSV